MDAADALRVPWLVLGQWPKEHLVAAEGVRPVAFDQVVWRLDVVLGLGHFLDFVAAEVLPCIVEHEGCVGKFWTPRLEGFGVEYVVFDQVDVDVQPLGGVPLASVGRDKLVGALDAIDEVRSPKNHPLVDHELEGLVKPDVSQVKQALRPKPRVQQVPGGVLGTSHVQVDLTPVVAFGPLTEGLFVVWVHVAQEIPTAASPTGHGVRLHRFAAEHGPIFSGSPRQRRFPVRSGQIRVHLGQGDGGVGDPLGQASFVAYRERLPPIALTAEDGVPDSVVDLASSDTGVLKPIERQGDGVASGLAIPIATSLQDGTLVGAHRFVGVVAFEDVGNVQVEVLRELPIALVACGHRHDGARAVSCQHVIRNPDGNRLAGDRVRHVAAGEHA